jgi:hypothetical protein
MHVNMVYLLVFLLPVVCANAREAYQWIELFLNETTRAEAFVSESIATL